MQKPPFTSVEFHGKGLEYFQIWIVNLFLSIATLGIYSAWAKVRNARYFYSHTRVDGHALRYLAEPLQILKGRIVGALLFGGFYVVGTAGAEALLLSLLALFVAAPFLICLSMRFQMRMTAYRNVRFAFVGRYGGALIAYVLCPLLSLLTLGLAYPWTRKKMDEFLHDNIRYGDRRFDAGALRAGRYYAATFRAALCAVPGMVVWTLLALWALFLLAGAWWPLWLSENETAAGLFSSALSGGYFLIFLLAGAIYTAMVRNYLFSCVAVPGLARFDSRVKIVPLAVLWLSNLLLLFATFGLALPWTRVRRARFFAAATGVEISDEIDEVIARAADKTGAIGEEVSTVFDMDVGVG